MNGEEWKSQNSTTSECVLVAFAKIARPAEQAAKKLSCLASLYLLAFVWPFFALFLSIDHKSNTRNY